MSQPLPASFWLWCRWRLGHGEYRARGPRSKPRPAQIPWAIPARWWTAYRRMFETKPPPPPPVTHPSPFAGRGMFCAWDPLAALRLGGLVDWVAVQAEGSSGGQPWSTPETVARLKAAGFVVHVWEAEAGEGAAALQRLGANGGYIGQAESAGQMAACLALPFARGGPPRAIVSNVTFLPDSPSAWPEGWACLPEAYTNANPNATVQNMHYEAYKRGAKDIFPCLGLYDASAEQAAGKRIPLRSYLVEYQKLGLGGFNGYLAETLIDDDVACLAGR